MGGGDLLNLLIDKDIFEENFARFYIAEVRPRFSEIGAVLMGDLFQMILAIEQCHKQGFIHRDIKPDVRHLNNCVTLALLTFLTDRTSYSIRTGISSSAILGWRE